MLRVVQGAAKPEGSQSVCEAQGLSYIVGGKSLIRAIDLSLAPRSLTMILGSNGAGKSLLLRLLHGMLEPSRGDVLWHGKPLDENQRLQQAMVFQRPMLLRRSVAANIRFALKQRFRRAPRSIEEILAEVGLEQQASQPARLLSGGEQQRLNLARALALQPRVLFLDEPTASLDPASTLAIERIVKHVHDQGTKIIFVSHDLGQARRLADDIVFLHEGQVAEHSPAEQFFQRPASMAGRNYLEGRLTISTTNNSS